MLIRILASVMLIISILYLPFWVSALLAILAMIYFSYFFETVIIFFIADLLYGATEERYFGVTFVTMILALILVLLVEFTKRKLRFYSEKNL